LNSIKILLSDLKEHKLWMFFILLCGALSSAFKAVTIGFVKIMGDLIFSDSQNIQPDVATEKMSFLTQFLDSIQTLVNVKPIFSAVFFLGVFFILANVMRYIFSFNIRSLAEFKSITMRENLMMSYLKMDSSLKSKLSDGSGGLMSRILNDVQVYQQGLSRLTDLIKEPMLVLFASFWLFMINYKIGAFIFLGLPPVFYVLKRVTNSLRKHSKKSQETMESLTMTLKESLDGARVVHSFSLQDKMQKRFKVQTRSYFSTVKKIISREEVSGPIMESISSIIFCATLLLLYYLAQDSKLSSGDFFAIIAAIGFLSDSARKTQGAFVRIQQAATAKHRINQLFLRIDTKDEKTNLDYKSFPKALNVIEFKNIDLTIDDKAILKNINLKIDAGQTVALVGSSGSGKSSFLNLIDMYIKPSKGSVLFNELDSKKMSQKSLCSNIALVSQDPFLFNMSVFENLKLVKPDLTEAEAKEALKLANADFIFDRKDTIHSTAGERGLNFSGGERQRLSIARALIKNSPILLLDEATSALDTQSEKEVQKGLDSLKKGRTCFVVAHRISTIVDADLTLVFENGEIIQKGTHAELVKKEGLYSDLCRMQYLN